MKKAVLSLSGGMDSSSLLLHLLANGYEVTALGFDYGQKHKIELERATELVKYINDGYDSEAEVPYQRVNKFDILEDGQKSCDILGLDFNEVYKRTNTSYKPMLLRTYNPSNFDQITETWFSDFKSAASVERIEAFIKLGRPDPVAYAYTMDNGDIIPVPWKVAKAHVEKVLSDYKK